MYILGNVYDCEGEIEWDRKVGVRQQSTHFLNMGFILKDYIETQMVVSIDEIID